MRAEKGRLRSGGDGSDGEGISAKGSPPVEATLALFSGIVKVGTDGIAQIPLQLPHFNGSVRLSAVAWSGDKVGSATKDIIVRDALALTVSAPRFLTLGDSARLQIDVHNIEGPASDYNLNVTFNSVAGSISGLQPLVQKILALKAGEKKADSVMLKPSDLGAMPMLVTITGPNGLTAQRPLTFDVKPPAGDIRRVTTAQLGANGGTMTLSNALMQDLIPSSAKATIHIGPLASLDVAGILSQLDRYPHGCAEQTTSRALPLLYVNDIARQIGIGQDDQLKARVQAAVERVFEMQDTSGAFGIWGPADGDIWLTSYVTDFLLRAQEAKFVVDPRGLKQALDRLQNYIAYAQDFDKGGEDKAYALYVLARGGRTPAGELRYAVDARLGRFATPLSLAHLGAAASLLGDKPRAEQAFAAAMRELDKAEPTAFRSDYGSSLRDRAAVITLASETKVVIGRMPQLVDVLAKAYNSKTFTSTQEQAWLLLAARSLSEQANSASLTVNGAPHQGKLIRGLSAAELRAGPMMITNTADTPTGAVISVLGSALTPEPPVANGIKINREYFTSAGVKVDLKSASGGVSTLQQNDRLVVVLKVEAELEGGRILVVDRLPAGLEIENARLLESGDVKTLDWLKTTRKPQHVEFRDDRFVAAFNFFSSETRGRGEDDDDAKTTQGPARSATVAYIVRAVTPGSFIHPAATVEDMYRPDRHARTATGRLDVTGK
jgi:alpha-2-macroglobulin